MATTRVLPPAAGGSTTVNGRTYTAAAGSFLDVPDFDAAVLEANGWQAFGGQSGTTAQRPANPAKKATFIDTTLNKPITWDGKAWRDHTGAAV